jgi:ribosome maturation factor RimP
VNPIRCRTSVRQYCRRGGVADDKDLEPGIEAILGNAGLHLLEFSLARHKGGIKVKAVVYSPSGTGTDECAKAHRLILPQIQLAYDAQNPEIEISSPGIDKTIKSEKEWKAFVGKAVKILLHGRDEWINGKLTGYSSGTIEFTDCAGPAVMDISSIAKARLDSSHKGEKANGI